MYHSGYKKSFRITGFALVELLVSISILVLVIGAIMVKQGAFNSAVLLRSQAYDVALEARETQLFAVSIVSDGSDYRNVYGLHFDKTPPANTGFKIFSDNNNNFYFNTGEEFGQQSTLDARFVVDDIRLIGGAYVAQNNLSVVFERPNFDARFFNASGELVNATAVEIDIRLKGTTGDTNGEVRTVEITRTGQISVQ